MSWVVGDLTSRQGCYLVFPLVLETFLLNLKIKRKAGGGRNLKLFSLDLQFVPMYPVMFSGFQSSQFPFLE